MTREKVPAGELPDAQQKRKQRKQGPLASAIFGIVYEVVAILLIFLVMFSFVFGINRNRDEDMKPSIRDGDMTVFYRLDKDYSVEDPIAIRLGEEIVVRRVAAIAGDTVDFQNGQFILNGIPQSESYVYEKTEQFTTGPDFPLTVPEGEVFVLGDAREHATDSRVFGCVRIEDTYGTVVMVLRRRGI